MVVHSSWRRFHTDAEIAALIGPELAARFALALPARRGRWESIRGFLEFPGAKHSIILDDDPGEFPPELALCPADAGLSDPAVQARLRSWISELPAARAF